MRTLIVASLGLAGCLDALAPDVGPLAVPDQQTCNSDSDGAVVVSFSGQIAPILNDRCERCHQPGGEGVRDSGLDLTSYDALRAGGTRSVGTIVVVGEPCASVLYQKLGEAPPFGARMPRGEQALSTTDQLLFHDWIAEGALEN